MSLHTPEAILSYPWLFKAQPPSEEGGTAKFGCALVFPPGTDLTEMMEAALSAARAEFGTEADAMLKDGRLKWPFRTNIDCLAKGYPEGSTVVNARNPSQPGIVSTVPDPNNDGKPTPITDVAQLYPGCVVKAALSCFAYKHSMNKGVTFGLQHIQKVGEGERIDGRKAAVDEFDSDPNAVAPLSALDESAQEDAPPEMATVSGNVVPPAAAEPPPTSNAALLEMLGSN